MPEDFEEPTWLRGPVRWIGTEVQPAFCTDQLAEAEAWALAYEPDAKGATHAANPSDPRWTDIVRFDADGVPIERQRIFHCDFMAELGPTPPGLDPIPCSPGARSSPKGRTCAPAACGAAPARTPRAAASAR